MFRPLVDVARQRHGEAQVIEDGGPQLPGEEADFGVDGLDERQRPAQLVVGSAGRPSRLGASSDNRSAVRRWPS